jgi:hypothetical protein
MRDPRRDNASDVLVVRTSKMTGAGYAAAVEKVEELNIRFCPEALLENGVFGKLQIGNLDHWSALSPEQSIFSLVVLGGTLYRNTLAHVNSGLVS